MKHQLEYRFPSAYLRPLSRGLVFYADDHVAYLETIVAPALCEVLRCVLPGAGSWRPTSTPGPPAGRGEEEGQPQCLN